MTPPPGAAEAGGPAVLTARQDAIAVITLNRPQARNAINVALAEQLQAALDEADDDPAIRVAVLCGAAPAFCAGGDLKTMRSGGAGQTDIRTNLRFFSQGMRKPIVCAVEGFALGGGFELALACDLIVAAEDSRFGLPEVRWGLAAGGGGLARLPRLTSPAFAKGLALTGEPATAPDLHRLGLIHALTPSGQALARAMEVAGRIAANSPMGVRISKQLIDAAQEHSLAGVQAMQGELMDLLFASEDVAEGAAAFLERRPPVWRDR